MASAAVESLQFKSADITASFTLDVIGGQAASGSGELRSSYWSGPATMNLITLSTPKVHDLGGGVLSYRFGGGTDLIGDDAGPIDAWGPVFIVDATPNLDVGFKVWANADGSYTGFIAGNSPGADQPIICLGETGALTAVPEPSTRAMMLLGFAGLGFAGYRSSRRIAAAHKKGRSAVI
jgi:hypothetical protein